jgi:hypothetical protein
LHHTHGIANCLLCPLAIGGRVNMLPEFDAKQVWQNLISDETSESRFIQLLNNLLKVLTINH